MWRSLLFSLLLGLFVNPALADYYSGYYWGRSNTSPVISLTLDPKKSLDSAFRIAAREERFEDMTRFLDQKADINSRSDEGETALMYGSRDCSVEVVKLLLSRGADVNIADNLGRTALIYAAQESCAPVIKILVKTVRIKTGHRDKAGYAAIDYARDNAGLDVDGPALEAVRLLGSASSRKNRTSGKSQAHLASRPKTNGSGDRGGAHVQ